MSRLKNTLAEDLIAAKKDIERLSEHNLRLNKEKEGLTKERGNLVIDLTGTERDNQSLSSVSNYTVQITGTFSQVGNSGDFSTRAQAIHDFWPRFRIFLSFRSGLKFFMTFDPGLSSS